MSIKPGIKKAFLGGLIVLSVFSFIYVNSQYKICPIGWGDNYALVEENVQQNEDKDGSFVTLPDLSMLQKAADLLLRLTRH